MIANLGPGMRERFLLEPDMAFLNHGSFGASPKEVLAVQSDLRQRLETQPVRFMSRELPQRLADAAAALAQFVGAEPADLAVVDRLWVRISAQVYNELSEYEQLAEALRKESR